MNTPSIESLLARTSRKHPARPIAKRLYDLPVIGTYVRAWVRLGEPKESFARWAVLPPVTI